MGSTSCAPAAFVIERANVPLKLGRRNLVPGHADSDNYPMLKDPRLLSEYRSSFKPEVGGARRDRTADLNTASVALSQLSYSPTSSPDERRGAQQYVSGRIVSSETTALPSRLETPESSDTKPPNTVTHQRRFASVTMPTQTRWLSLRALVAFAYPLEFACHAHPC